MADVQHYDLGDVAVETITFKVNAALTDPGAVTATVLPPSGTPINYTYGVDAQLGKSAVGSYFLQVTVNQAGEWQWVVRGTSPAPGTAKGMFVGDPDFDTLASTALTTVYNVELALDRLGVQRSDADEAEEQAYISRLIGGYSTAAQAYIDRTLSPVESMVTKRFVYDGSGYLDLAPYELNDLTSITLYADRAVAGQWVLTSDEYSLRPQPQTPFGTWSYMRLSPRTSNRDGIMVDIDGDWGAVVVPTDVSLAVDVAVALGYTRQEQATPRVLGGLEVVEGGLATLPQETGFSLPQASRNLLGPYRRV